MPQFKLKNIKQKISATLIVIIVAGIGTYTLHISHAATPYAYSEAVSGTLTPSAVIKSDPAASNGKYVQFGSTVYGVLAADTSHLQTDTQAGIQLAQINVGWNEWEPTEGNFDQRYISQIASEVNSYQAADWEVVISIGLQFPPNWVLNLPNGQLEDQNGKLSGTPNYEFNQAIRTAAASFINNIVSALSKYNISYYRVGLSDSGEMLMGPATNNDSWWAFDNLAQGKASGLPSGISASPLPGWVPGTSTYNGQTITSAQVQSWYNWYLSTLENAETWEINTYRSAGYSGALQLVMPGDGATPTIYAKSIIGDLASESFDPYYTMNTGAVWQDILGSLPLKNTVIDISSVQDDGSSMAVDNCQANDAATSLSNADPWNNGWSSVRWLTYLADQHNLQVMGENPGSNSATDMINTFVLAKSCKLIALQWAFDDQLYDGTDASISDYAAQIQAAQ